MQTFKPKPGQLVSSGDGIDLSLLPPSQDSLQTHIFRANYQDTPSPIGHGWMLDEDSCFTFECTKKEIMPQQLIDILYQSDIENEGDSLGDHFGSDDQIEIDNMMDIMFEDTDEQ